MYETDLKLCNTICKVHTCCWQQSPCVVCLLMFSTTKCMFVILFYINALRQSLCLPHKCFPWHQSLFHKSISWIVTFCYDYWLLVYEGVFYCLLYDIEYYSFFWMPLKMTCTIFWGLAIFSVFASKQIYKGYLLNFAKFDNFSVSLLLLSTVNPYIYSLKHEI